MHLRGSIGTPAGLALAPGRRLGAAQPSVAATTDDVGPSASSTTRLRL
jgi:hypothetical protein